MLVLSRKLREQVLIPGSNIRITVLSIGTNRVQLGFEAPPDIHITRPEIVLDLADLDSPQVLPTAGQAIREVTFRAEPITSGGPA